MRVASGATRLCGSAARGGRGVGALLMSRLALSVPGRLCGSRDAGRNIMWRGRCVRIRIRIAIKINAAGAWNIDAGAAPFTVLTSPGPATRAARIAGLGVRDEKCDRGDRENEKRVPDNFDKAHERFSGWQFQLTPCSYPE